MRQRLKKYLPDHASVSDNRWLRPFQSSLLHPRLWHLNRHSAAGAVAAGLFCGLIPGPLQMLGAAICALIFRVNLPLAMAVTLYTNPFTIVPLYIVAYHIGNMLTGGSTAFAAPPDFDAINLLAWVEQMLAWISAAGKPLLIGLPALAAGLALAGYLAVKLLWRFYLIRQWRQRKVARTQAGRC